MFHLRIVVVLTATLFVGSYCADPNEDLDYPVVSEEELKLKLTTTVDSTGPVALAQGCPCVYFSGSSLDKYMKGLTFCVSSDPSSREHNGKPSFSNSAGQFLYYDTNDNTWDVADSVGASTIRMMVKDEASHPKDISTAWQVGDDYAFDGAPTSMMHNDHSIKVHCGKYKPFLSTTVIIGIVVGVALVSIIPGVVLRVYCIRKRRAAQGSGQFGFSRMV